MKLIPDSSIDLIFTSPPYEDVTGAGYEAARKDVLFLKLYSTFMDAVFNEFYRILKPSGQILFNIKSKTHNGSLRTPHWLEFLSSFQRFKLKSYIIWKYAGSFDSTDKRFHLDYEIIYHLSKTDNIYLNPNCGIKDSLSSVWYIPHNIPKDERIHPTQMTEKLVERALSICTKEGDLVLDPFLGSGTTAVVCKRMNRNYIGFEISPECYESATRRLNNTTRQT